MLSAKFVRFVSSELLGKKILINVDPRLKNSTCNWYPSRIQKTSHYHLSPVILPVCHASGSSSDTNTSQLKCRAAVGNLSSTDVVVTWHEASRLVKQFPLAVQQKHATVESRGPKKRMNWLEKDYLGCKIIELCRVKNRLLCNVCFLLGERLIILVNIPLS